MSSVSRKALLIEDYKRRIVSAAKIMAQTQGVEQFHRVSGKHEAYVGFVRELESLPSSESEGEAVERARALLGNDYVIVPLANWNRDAEQYRALMDENEQLREHIKGIQRIIISGRDYKEYDKARSVLISAEWACAEALSTSETAVHPVKADQVRSMYEAWANMDGPAIYSSETIANIIADVALVVGISIPGIDPNDPMNFIPGTSETGREADQE